MSKHVKDKREEMSEPTRLEGMLYPARKKAYRRWLDQRADERIEEAKEKAMRQISNITIKEIHETFEPADQAIDQLKRYRA